MELIKGKRTKELFKHIHNNQTTSYKRKIFKVITFLFLLTTITKSTYAQTFAEWFSQKKTQIKYLAQQIAALEQYHSYIKQGYSISQNGLGNIGGYIKNEHGMHSTYYSSLTTVNPQLKSNSKADSIVSYTNQIRAQFDHLSGLNGLDKDNRAYITKVERNVIDECNKDLTEFQLVITSGETQMTDDERIKRLDEIYVRMKDKYAFTQSFCNQLRMLLLQRNRELQDIQTLGRYQ